MIKQMVSRHPGNPRNPWRHSPAPSLTPAQKSWLLRPGALTTGLRALGTLELRVLREFSAGLSADEARVLKLPLKTPVWIREIAMRIDGTDCVVARSLTTLGASHGVWQGMRRLRTRPLADILYHNSAIVRSDFEVARVARTMPMMSPVHAARAAQTADPLLARRSVFWRSGAPLMVAECFLPAFWLLIRPRLSLAVGG